MNKYIFFSIISVEQKGIQLNFKLFLKTFDIVKAKKTPNHSNACLVT